MDIRVGDSVRVRGDCDWSLWGIVHTVSGASFLLDNPHRQLLGVWFAMRDVYERIRDVPIPQQKPEPPAQPDGVLLTEKERHYESWSADCNCSPCSNIMCRAQVLKVADRLVRKTLYPPCDTCVLPRPCTGGAGCMAGLQAAAAELRKMAGG